MDMSTIWFLIVVGWIYGAITVVMMALILKAANRSANAIEELNGKTAPT